MKTAAQLSPSYVRTTSVFQHHAPGARVHDRGEQHRIRKEIDLIIDRVEPIGWQCVRVEPFFASVEIDFIRRP